MEPVLEEKKPHMNIIHVQTHTHTHTCVCVCVCVCVCAYMHKIYITRTISHIRCTGSVLGEKKPHIYMAYVYTHIHICMRVCMCVCVCMIYI